MSTGNVRLLDGLESSGVEESPRTPVDEEDAPPPPRPPRPPTASNRQTLRHNTAVDLAERCSDRLGLIQAVSSSAEFARKVDRGTRRLLYIDQLSQFVASSQAIPVAVGLVFGRTLSNNVDSFVKAFVSPLLAALGGKTHLDAMHFKINEAVFAYGDFLQSVIQTAFTVVALFYLVVIPMSTFTSLKYVHHVLCPEVCLYFECQSWIKETARRCPMCGQPKDHAEGSGGGGRAHALGQDAHGRAHRHTPHAHGEDEPDAAEELSEVERQRHGVTKNRLRSLGKLWSSAAR